MSYYVIFIVSVLFSLSLAILTERKFARVCAVGNFALVFFAYTSGLFKRLDIGVYLYIAATAVLVGFAIYKTVKQKGKSISDVIKQPLFWFYIAFGITLGITFTNKICSDCDEYTHWGLVVKNMIAYDNFGNLGDTTTMFNRYVPATGVFMYAFQIFNKTMVNGHFYAAFDMLMISMLIALPAKYEGKRPAVFLATAVVSFALLYMIKRNVYFNLLVDQMLAVMTAYIYFVYLNDRGKANALTVADIALSSFVTILTKSSGLPLIFFGYMFIATDVIARGRQFVKPFFKNKFNLIALATIVLAIVYAKVSWNVYCDVNAVRAGWDSSEMTLPNIIEYIKNPNDFQKQVTSTFFKTFFIGDFFYEYNDYLQQPNLFVIGVFGLFGAAVCIKQRKAGFGMGMFGLTAVLILSYGIVMLMMYVFSFSYKESLRLASYPRYFGTVVSAFGLVWLAITADVFFPITREAEEKTKKISPFIKIIPAMIVGVLMIACALFGNAYFVRETNNITRGYRKWIEAVSELDKEDRVYYAQKDFSYGGNRLWIYLRARFFATPTRCSGYNSGGDYAEGRDVSSPFTGDMFEMKKTSKEDLENILLNYDYFYVRGADADFAAKYGEMFEGEVKDEVMYVVEKNDGKVVLKEKK